jgi:hypothetical protein
MGSTRSKAGICADKLKAISEQNTVNNKDFLITGLFGKNGRRLADDQL